MTSSKKVRKIAGHSGGQEGPRERFWTQKIEPRGAALLSETCGPCYFVIKGKITALTASGWWQDMAT